MPNWCQNEFEIFSDSKEKLEALTVNGKFFENIVPLGKWEYDKALSSWGTKWDLIPSDLLNFEIHEVDEKSYTLRGYMDTAWTPPIPVYEALMEKGFNVSASFIEYGCEFCGIFDNGDEFIKEEIPPKDDPFWNSEIGQLIDDDFNVVEFMEEWKEEEDE
jgi:hypothetical protein